MTNLPSSSTNPSQISTNVPPTFSVSARKMLFSVTISAVIDVDWKGGMPTQRSGVLSLRASAAKAPARRVYSASQRSVPEFLLLAADRHLLTFVGAEADDDQRWFHFGDIGGQAFGQSK